MKKLLILTTALLLTVVFSFAQDTLVMMNGKYINGDVVKVENQIVFLKVPKKDDFKIKKVEIEDLFSIQYRDNSSTVFYEQDSSMGYYRTQEEMYTYIKGSNYAHNVFKSPLSTAGGFVTGLTGGVIGFWGLTVPTAYTALTGTYSPKFVYDETLIMNYSPRFLVNTTIEDEEGMNDETEEIELVETPIIYDKNFLEGYAETAKDKKTKNALKGAFIGFVSLVASSYILISL